MSVDTTVPTEQVETNSTTAVPAPRRIMIADDDAGIRSFLRDLLAPEGYEVVEATSGAEVLRAVPKVEPNLLILDLRMGDMNGIEVLSRLSAQGHKVPVLNVTAFGTASSVIEATKLGAVDYLTK